MSQQGPAQSRQPTSYPSPHSYPSPSMSAYAYPPPQQQQAVEPYRASPTGSHVSLPSISLPPIRSLDPRQQQGPASLGSPLPPPAAPMGAYYHNQQQSLPPPQQHPNVTSSPHHQPLRYPLPAPDGRIMSGGRHKKEIKRRTKTGCLTCRKRRIKCDEAHPTCRNCQKSKRECLGYDPIFKAQPGPAAIQPAPTSAPPAGATTSAPYPAPVPGYASSITGSYGPALSTGASSPGSSVEPYDYSSAIDPALQAAGPSQIPAPPPPYDQQVFRPELKRELDRASFPAKRIKIDDLLTVGRIPPPLTPPPSENAISIAPATLTDIKTEYLSVFAPALDNFLETTWFQRRGFARVVTDNQLRDQFSSLFERLRNPYIGGDRDTLVVVANIQSRIVWSLMVLCQAAAVNRCSNGLDGDGEGDDANDDGLGEAAKRCSIIESLVSGMSLEANPLSPSDNSTVQHDHRKYREVDFWRLIGRFLSLRDDEASAAKEIDNTLSSARTLLDSQENRDVIYSIAVARHLGQRVAEYPPVSPVVHNDEEDASSRLFVAKKFIEDEATGKGTNYVIQRLCAMAMKIWNTSG
ncbi:hypothetical protein FGG08_002885 [Glutinoglossum americanum]|uniref:Zn(2)-C6 fungal-type domain-containing protein n=1 Tax=Glutinoglossum americanum TaxID=1670608 RepID=A0A9P8IEC3_9PEZI|nr:hypothetical protein FGG08_002885 [Glutinoglossum americanum]